MFKIVLQFLITTLLVSHATPLLQTGQTISYDENGTIVSDGSVKDDGFYQVGVTRSYSRSGDVVTDNVTGLEWQDDENITKQWVTQANFNAGNYFDTSGDTATIYCSELTLDGGGWRLPSIEELETIVDDGKYNPILSEGVFLSYASFSYWSSTTSVSETNSAWYIYFRSGYSISGHKYNNYYVRCVRGGQ